MNDCHLRMRGVVKHAGMGLRVTVMHVNSNFMYKRGETEQLHDK